MAHERPSHSTSFNHGWTYDVFVSFCGEDTRYSFTGNLCNALDQKGINTFKDDVKLRKGESISPALLKAIEESRISIIVFSENYASSSWCLDELVKIIECMKEKGQLVRPVFYYVDPSDVRHQRGSYGSSMAEHEAKLKNSKETVRQWRLAVKRVHNWRVALREAANLSGWHFKKGYEFEFIQRITEEISSKLNHIFLHIADYPVGLKYRIFKMVSFLNLKSNKEACLVGIHGIGGIGKTTLVKAVYNSIANQFEGSCFLADVRENSMKHGLVQLQETLLLNLLGENTIKLGNVSQGIPILENRLRSKKILLVLDDVDNLKQLRSLAGKQDWFGYGSRIVITTRNKHLLIAHGVENLCEVNELNEHEALELFSWNAFKRSEPDARYMEVSKLIVQYSKGLPLALSVIGSDLFGKKIEEWKSAMKKYERIPSKEILDVLKVSYDNLDDNEKEIFLDIACFFKGNSVEDVEKTLDASGFYSKYGIGVLVDKSLVNIDDINRVKMHDLIQDLGRDITRKDSPFDPRKRRRLWHHEDVLEVLIKNTGTDTIEGIMLDLPNLKQVQLRANAFEKFPRLRILIVRNAQVSRAPEHLPNSLRLLEWKEYPSSSLPDDFHPETLVAPNMPQSHLTIDQPFKKFENLTFMNFSDCDSITRLPDVSAIPNLTSLLANNCSNLAEIHDSVGNLDKLVILSVEKCLKLESFPLGMKSTSLESLDLGKCPRIRSFPNMLAKMKNMRRIGIEGTTIEKFPSSIAKLDGLEVLDLASRTSFEDLPVNTDMFQNIEEINVEGCPKLSKLLGKTLVNQSNWTPKLNRLVLKDCDLSDENLKLIISSFSELKWLILSNNNFVTIPECIEDLTDLLFLDVDNCKQLRDISVLPPNLQYIDARNCISLTPDSSNVLLSQALQEVEYIDIVVLRKKIPHWFDHCSKGGSVAFWVRRKFPGIAVFFLLGGEIETDANFTCEFCLLINGVQVFQDEGQWPMDHVWLFDLRLHFAPQGWHNLNEHLQRGWNHVEISCTIKKNQTQNGTVKCCGIHLYKERMNIDDVSFISPALHGSDMAYDNMDCDSEIYDEESKDVVFPQILAKHFDEIAKFMEGLRSSRRKDDDEFEQDSSTPYFHGSDISYDNVDNDSDSDDEESRKDDDNRESEDVLLRIMLKLMEGLGSSRTDDDDYDFDDKEEQSLTSTNSQISESCEVAIKDKGKDIEYSDNPEEEQSADTWDSMILECLRGEISDEGVKTSKIFMGSTAEAELEPMFQKRRKSKEDVNLVLGSTSTASTSTDKGGQQKKGPSNIKISEKDASIKRNAEATVHYKQNQAEKSHTQLLESRANQQSAAKEIEDGLISTEAFITEDNMDAFYASLETETTALSDTQINNVFLKTKPSEETQKALQILRDLVSKKFSLLLQPEESKSIKYILEYLLSLSPDDGISLKTKSVILQLSRSFTQWNLDYNDASNKLESAGDDLSKVDELKEGLEANVREFREVEKFENEMWSKLADLEKEKRKLEEQINAIKAQIVDFTSAKDTAVQRKIMVFDHGRRLKARWDDLSNRLPRLRAEEEWAKITQVNIEDEWSKLGEQFIASSSFEDWN